MNRTVSIVIPSFNESGNIAAAVTGVLLAAHQARLDEFELILVDDGSTDGTGAVMRDLARCHVEITHVVCHPENAGLRAAYETGLSCATLPYIGWFPGDGEMATESIADILRAVGTADLVIPYHGTPWLRPWVRRALTWISTTEMNLLLGNALDYYQGPVVYPTALARSLPRTIDGFFFAAEMLSAAMTLNPSYVQIPLTHQERAYGVSKAVGWRRIWDAQMAVFGFFWRFRLGGSPVRTPVLEATNG